MSDCCPEQVKIRVQNSDGSFTNLPAVNNVVTLPGVVGETLWEGISGCGITVTPGGDSGHGPTFDLNIDPDSPIPITCNQDGQVRVGPAGASPNWTSPNTAKTGGIRVVAGGQQGHNPTFLIAIGPGEPFGINPDGCLVWTGGGGFSCSDLESCSIGSFGDVDTSNGPGFLVVTPNGDVVTLDPGSDGVIVILDDGTAVIVPRCEIVAECLTGDPSTFMPSLPPAGAGPWTLTYDGAALQWQ